MTNPVDPEDRVNQIAEDSWHQKITINLAEQPVAKYTVLDTNIFGLAKATISVLEPGVYRGKYMNYDWQLLKDKVVSDKIVITSEISQKIINQIQNFWGMEEDFKENGLLHKRGFLLVGKAGCGKSSVISTVIKNAIEKGCIVFIPDPAQAGQDFGSCMKKIKAVEQDKKILVIMEDFESYLENGSCTSKWLNILDGADGFNNVVYLATSNFPEQIDARFTNRPSRFDTVYVIDAPNFDDRLNYIKNRKMKIDEETARDIAKDTAGLSYAHIKELLVSVYMFKLDYDNTMEKMHNQGENPITSRDFEEKRRKIGFETDPEKNKNKDDLELNEKEVESIMKELKNNGEVELGTGAKFSISPNLPDSVLKEIEEFVKKELEEGGKQ